MLGRGNGHGRDAVKTTGETNAGGTLAARWRPWVVVKASPPITPTDPTPQHHHVHCPSAGAVEEVAEDLGVAVVGLNTGFSQESEVNAR